MPIRCYGLKWSYAVSMVGRRDRGPPIRFNDMHGIYVLYDREGRLAYVGRSGKGKNPGIGGRIYCHKVEQGWDFDTYSWFGVLPVSHDGAIIRDAESLTTEELTGNLEALLIHLLEPSWNGTSGAYRHIPQYEQVSL